MDLLDFPGYRGRYDKARLSEIPNNPVELLRRGKVAYLFELYTENQEMNGLVLCTPAHKQPRNERGGARARPLGQAYAGIPPETAPNARDCCGR